MTNPSQELEREESSHLITIKQRDHAEFAADALASSIAEYFGVEIGEHSSANCPWNNALECIQANIKIRKE